MGCFGSDATFQVTTNLQYSICLQTVVEWNYVVINAQVKNESTSKLHLKEKFTQKKKMQSLPTHPHADKKSGEVS